MMNLKCLSAGLSLALVSFFPAGSLRAQALSGPGPIQVDDEKAQKTEWERLMSDSETARRGGEYKVAHQDCEKALAIARNFPPPDTHTSQTQVQNGNIYLSERETAAAETAFKDAVRTCELAVGADHPLMIMPLESLANCYFMRQRFDQVAPLYQRILEITQRGVMLQNLEVGRRSRNLAEVYFSLKDYARAEPLFLRAIALAEPSGIITDLVEFRLAAGRCYEGWNKPDDAAAQYRKAADLAMGVEDDFQSFQALQALTSVEKNSGHFEAAEAAARRALAFREKRATSDSGNDAQLDLAVSLKNVADVYLAWSKPDLAEPLYQRSLSLVEKAAAPGSGESIGYRLALADAQRRRGKLKEAEHEYSESLTEMEKIGVQETPQMHDLLTQFASLLQELKKPAEAERLLARAEALSKEAAVH